MRPLAFFSSLLLLVSFTGAEEIQPGGRKLLAFLNSMEVDKHWIAGTRVDWQTGAPTSEKLTTPGAHTHCSAFAAAACDRLGIYLLRPPEHGQAWLATAQFHWLAEKGPENGWSPVADDVSAQKLANAGSLVLAVCEETAPGRSGHIAIVLPSDRPASELKDKGLLVTQAGKNNHLSAPLTTGFSSHTEALAEHRIKYFAHPHDWSAAAVGAR